jgi:hypothetical protein
MVDSTSNDIIAIVFESKRPSKKNEHMVEPFIKSNIKYVGLAPLQDNGLFEGPLYLVYDDNKSAKPWFTAVMINPKVSLQLIISHFATISLIRRNPVISIVQIICAI